MLRRIVALRFREGTAPATKTALYADLARLSGHIAETADFRTFANIAVEPPLVRGYNDVFWFDFRDAAVRVACLADPEHQAIGGRIVAELEGGTEGVFVVDVRI